MKLKKESPIFYPGDDVHRIKQGKIQDAISDAGLDALLLFKAEAVRYATDFYVKGYRPFMEPEYVVLVPRDEPPVVGYTSGSDDLRIRFRSDIEDSRRLPSLERWPDVLAGMISDYALERARIGFDIMPLQVFQGLSAHCPYCEFVEAGDIWTGITAIKHPAEIDHIRNAVRIADIGMAAAVADLVPGISEQALSARAVAAMRAAGSEFEPFIPLVASGYNASIFERVATEKVIENGELVILDIGAVYRGYTGDLGRTVACGRPSEAQKDIFRVVHTALEEAKKTVRPGVSCQDVDTRAREVIAGSAWGNHLYTGNTGHQLGFGLHGTPLIDQGVVFELAENMVMCLEPRIVLPDRPDIGGVHLEDVIRVTRDGFEQVNTTPLDERLLS